MLGHYERSPRCPRRTRGLSRGQKPPAYDRPLTMVLHEGENQPRLSRWQCRDGFQVGEIQDSDLVRELRAYYGIRLFHLVISTSNEGTIDIVFGHVKVRKSNAVPLSDYLGGKSIRWKCFYQWKPGTPRWELAGSRSGWQSRY
jgi:hypothetical protein